MKKMSTGGKIILVVEDEPAIAYICRESLRAIGFTVDTAINGKVAQKKIERKQYDLYLIDIKMPEMGGIELYQWLCEKHPNSTGRVMFITGSVMGGNTMHFLEQSGRPLLLKPFTPDELKSAVSKAFKEIKRNRGTQFDPEAVDASFRSRDKEATS